MTRVVWDGAGERHFEAGVDRGVVYPMDALGAYPMGYAWNGLISVSENPSGAEPNPMYADNIKYLELMSAEQFGITIEAYTYPNEFEQCDGSAAPEVGVSVGQQGRKKFGFTYRTLIGNDVDGQDHGYKVHLVYGCLASPSEKSNQSINESPEAITFSWEVTTTPAIVTGLKPTASIVIDSTKVQAADLAALEDLIYGNATPVTGVPKLPTPDEVIALFNGA